MKDLVETGINLHKSIAMGMHNEMYEDSAGSKDKPKPKPGYGPPKGPRPVKTGGKGY